MTASTADLRAIAVMFAVARAKRLEHLTDQAHALQTTVWRSRTARQPRQSSFTWAVNQREH